MAERFTVSVNFNSFTDTIKLTLNSKVSNIALKQKLFNSIVLNVGTFDSGRSVCYEYKTYSEAHTVKFSLDPKILALNNLKMIFNLDGGVDDFLTVDVNNNVIANYLPGYWNKCKLYCSDGDDSCSANICFPDPVKTSPLLPFNISITDKGILKENNIIKLYATSPVGNNWLIINSGTITLSYYSE